MNETDKYIMKLSTTMATLVTKIDSIARANEEFRKNTRKEFDEIHKKNSLYDSMINKGKGMKMLGFALWAVIGYSFMFAVKHFKFVN